MSDGLLAEIARLEAEADELRTESQRLKDSLKAALLGHRGNELLAVLGDMDENTCGDGPYWATRIRSILGMKQPGRST